MDRTFAWRAALAAAFTALCPPAMGAGALAQEQEAAPSSPPSSPTPPAARETARGADPTGEDATPGEKDAAGADGTPDPDNVADLLNARQQLQQSITLKRTINGEVVESEKRTVTFSRDAPRRATEADRESLREVLKSQFDGEVLTRNEAFEEAKIDFIIADTDRSGAVDAEEFASLVATWADDDARAAPAPTDDIARQRRYDDFLTDISQGDAELARDVMAKRKFAFMAGASQTLSREDYIREYLLDFDAMDANNDARLEDEELRRFRAVSRGEDVADAGPTAYPPAE